MVFAQRSLIPAIYLCLALPVVLLLREANPIWWSTASARSLISGAELLFCLLALPFLRNPWPHCPPWLLASLSLWLICAFISTALSPIFWQGLPYWSELVIHVFFLGCCYVYTVHHPKALIWLGYGLIASCLLCLLAFLITWFSLSAPRHFNWVTEFPFFSNIRHFGHLLAIAVPVAMIFWHKVSHYEGNAQRTSIWLILLALLWMMVFVSGGRGAFLSLVIISICYLLMFPKRAWPLALSIGVGLLLSQYFWVSNNSLNLFRFIGHDEGLTLNQLSSGRLVIYLTTLQDWWQHAPFLGFGADYFRFAHYPFSQERIAHPHNSALQLLYFFGIFGFIIPAFWVIRFLKASLTYSKEHKVFILPALSALLLSIVDGNFFIAYSTFIGMIAMTVALVPLSIQRCHSTADATPNRTYALAFKLLSLAVLSVALMIYLAFMWQVQRSHQTGLSLEQQLIQAAYPLYFEPTHWIRECNSNVCKQALIEQAIKNTDDPCWYYRRHPTPNSDTLQKLCGIKAKKLP